MVNWRLQTLIFLFFLSPSLYQSFYLFLSDSFLVWFCIPACLFLCLFKSFFSLLLIIAVILIMYHLTDSLKCWSGFWMPCPYFHSLTFSLLLTLCIYWSVSSHHLDISPIFIPHLSGLPAFASWVLVRQSGHSASAIQDDAVFILGAEGQRDLRADIKRHRVQLHKSRPGETDCVDVLQHGRDWATGYSDRKWHTEILQEKTKGETSMLQPLVSPV